MYYKMKTAIYYNSNTWKEFFFGLNQNAINVQSIQIHEPIVAAFALRYDGDHRMRIQTK
jgi:hypothetical protein